MLGICLFIAPFYYANVKGGMTLVNVIYYPVLVTAYLGLMYFFFTIGDKEEKRWAVWKGFGKKKK